MALNRLLLPRKPSLNLLSVKRCAGLLLASILLHFIALHWSGISLQPPTPRSSLTIMSASLHTAPAQNTASPFPNENAMPIPNLVPAPTSKERPVIDASNNNVVTPPLKPATTAISIPLMASSNALGTSTASLGSMHYSIDLPPSAELRYEASAIKKGITFEGQGTVIWQANGDQYQIKGDSDMGEMGRRSFQSEGTIDQFGIAPLLYTEKSNTKSATNTHFQRERNIISFSSSTANYPRQGGEQDRASIIWQLSGIARGSPDKFIPNTDIDIFVAGVRDGDTWHIHIVGEEDIHTPMGRIPAWHLTRMPRPGTYEQRLDIWLAPQQAWYPVQLRYTQANGDTLNMLLSKISPVLVQ
jgi:hypothetical protein